MARPVGTTFSLVGITRRHDRRAGRMIATRKRGVDEERIERLVTGAMSVDAARRRRPSRRERQNAPGVSGAVD